MCLFQVQNWIPRYLLLFLLHGTVLLEKLQVISDSEEISCISQNPKVHCHVNNSLPLVRTISQWIAMPANPVSLRPIFILSSDLHPGLPNCLRFTNQNPDMYLFFTIHDTCLTQLILFDLNTHTVSGVDYTSWHFTLHILLWSPVTSSLLAPNICPNTLLLNTISMFFLDLADGVSHT